MKTFSKMKKAIWVFRSYGIPLTGKRKSAHFYDELRMDSVFVNGLIFELELQLQMELEEEKLVQLQSPSQVLDELFA